MSIKAFNLAKRVQFYRGVAWDEFGEAWTSRPPENADKKLTALRFFGVMILW